MGLRSRITLSMVVLTMLAVVLMGVIIQSLSRHFFTHQKEQNARMIVQAIERSIRESPYTKGPYPEARKAEAARWLIGRHFSSGTMQGMVFANLAGDVLYSTAPPQHWKAEGQIIKPFIGEERYHVIKNRELVNHRPVLTVIAQWRIQGRLLGYAMIHFHLTGWESEVLFGYRLILLYALLYGAVLASFGFFVLDRTVVRPLKSLSQAAELLAAGSPSPSLDPTTGAGETRQLILTFQNMADRIATQRGLLQRRIHEMERMHQELERTQENLIRSEKNASLGLLAAGIAHEIGNPLAAILGYTELLAEADLDPEESGDVLTRITNDIERINKIIKGLLDYARDNRGDSDSVGLSELMNKIVDIVKPQALFGGIRFQLAEPASEAVVQADPDHLQQVFINLFINAAQAMDGQGEIKVSIVEWVALPEPLCERIARRFRGDLSAYAAVLVRDHGPGIPESLMDQVFDPFYTTKDIGEGTGLGLSICQRITEAHGGTIIVESEQGEGSTFTVVLPLASQPE